MTVIVRPVPKRTWQNGIRPFRPAAPANYIRPYPLKTRKLPVPDPLPPAPLLSPKELLALGALVLAQVWGFFKQTTFTPEPSTIYPDGCKEVASGNFLWFGIPPNSADWGIYFRKFISVVDTGRPGNNGTTYWRLTGEKDDGSLTTTEYPRTPLEMSQYRISHGGGTCIVENYPPTELVPGTIPEVQPEVKPRRKIPLPTAPPLAPPAPVPAPEPSPVPEEPGPRKPPVVVPITPAITPRTLPPSIPGVRPTKDGALVPQAPAPVATTTPDAHFPVPGAPPVTGNGPRPTPEGIAQELGRLEQKLARLSDPGPGGLGDGTDRLGLLFQILGKLVEFLTAINFGGVYSLSSPCVLDENDERIVSTVEYEGAPTTLGVVMNKIDALAALIQVHKDLKQPNCTPKKPVGQPVTVNFVQID